MKPNLLPDRVRRRAETAFTMIEIALSLAIIGFALVAIVGILPIGMQTQQDNREETIINQDGTYLLEAIRNGARGLDHLTNYVDQIRVDWTVYSSNNATLQMVDEGWIIYTPTSPANFPLNNGERIIGILSTPKYILGNGSFVSNHVTARFRTISGLAVEKATNQSAREFALGYRLTSEVIPHGFYGTNALPLPPAGTPEWNNALANRRNLRGNLHEVRLTVRWPTLPNDRVGNSRMVFRTTTSGQLVQATNLFLFTPNTYVKTP